jgi:hypothetical protein
VLISIEKTKVEFSDAFSGTRFRFDAGTEARFGCSWAANDLVYVLNSFPAVLVRNSGGMPF